MADHNEIHSIVSGLFFITPSQLAILSDREEFIRAAESDLQAFKPMLDLESLDTAQQLNRRMTGLNSSESFFDSNVTRNLRKKYEALDKPELGSVDKMLEFQLSTLANRLCQDFLDSKRLYSEHSEVFNRQLSRVLIRNEFTGETNWSEAKAAMTAILEKNFAERYANFEAQHGQSYRKSRLDNEAICISKFIIDQAKQSDLRRTTSQIGLDFEQKCGTRLQDLGFAIEFTKISGDFGCDIVAVKDGLRYALQCKGLNSPAGISSVQEAAAARSHYKADYAVVVSKGGYTKAAKDLADSAHVVLVVESGLQDMETLAQRH